MRAVFDAGEIELHRERRLAQIAADAVERAELARRSAAAARPPLPGRAGGTRLRIDTFVVSAGAQLDRRPVDLLDAHRIRHRRIDHVRSLRSASELR